MKNKRFIAILLIGAMLCSILTACSAKTQETNVDPTNVVEVTDADDEITVKVDSDEASTIEITDVNGNVLTIVPVYNSDGVSIIAGYIEKAVDKDGNALDEKAFTYLKAVIALDIDEEKNCSIRYTDDKKFITLEALCDSDGYIIALQDSIDIDKDKDTEEYFKVVTKVDSSKNLFIKLDKDDKGNLINVTVSKDDKGNAQVTDEKGKTQAVKNSKDSENLDRIPAKEEEQKNQNSNSSNNNNNNNNDSNNEDDKNPDEPAQPVVDYTAIVLQNNGKVACAADNVTVKEASAVNGGTEIVVDGAGEHSNYYITSETGMFSGQIEFRFSVTEDVNVKFYNVNMSTSKKTAVKFTDVDSEKNKENDGEEAGAGTNQSGSSIETPAPKVELSLTGSNSFKASGSGKNGTIYSECKLAIKGRGSAEIDGGQNLSGICSTESVTIKNATLNITSNAKQGISCDKKVTLNSGANITIHSLGDGIHCNKFETAVLESGETPSTLTIKSLNATNCADGIDANDYIIINSGTINVTALTPAKYALKVRKVIKENPKGIFQINGGTVTASGGGVNVRPTDCAQKTVLATSRVATVFTAGDLKSSSDARSFIASPADVSTVSISSGNSRNVNWDGNIGIVSL